MEIKNLGRSLMALAVVGMAMLALSLIPMSTVEAGTKPHTLRGVAHGQTVELHWKEPSSPTLDGDSKYRYVVFRREVSSTTTAKCQLPLGTNPTETWTDDGTCDGSGESGTSWTSEWSGAGKYIYRVGTRAGGTTQDEKTGYYKAIVTNGTRSMAGKYKAHSLRTDINSGVRLRWEVISTHRVNGYKIFRRHVGGTEGWATLVEDTSTSGAGQSRVYRDTTAQSGETYRYRVQARSRPAGCSNDGCEAFGKATKQSTTTQ